MLVPMLNASIAPVFSPCKILIEFASPLLTPGLLAWFTPLFTPFFLAPLSCFMALFAIPVLWPSLEPGIPVYIATHLRATLAKRERASLPAFLPATQSIVSTPLFYLLVPCLSLLYNAAELRRILLFSNRKPILLSSDFMFIVFAVSQNLCKTPFEILSSHCSIAKYFFSFPRQKSLYRAQF